MPSPARLAVALLFATTAATAHADPLRIFAAGSLSGVMGELVTASGLSPASVAPPVFGPAGLLRQRIEAGEAADLYASADLAQPQRLTDAGRGGPVVPFARNRMCVVGAGSLGLAPNTVLDRMLDPKLRLATSTPVSDPGGDFAWAVFARAETVRRGARATLEAKAEQLFGGPTTMVPTNGHTPGGAILLANRSDLVLYYCSGAAAILKEVPDTVSVPLPATLDPGPVNGLTVLGNNPEAMRLAMFMVSVPGQAILARAGLLPVLSSQAALTVTGPDGQATPLSTAELAALPVQAMALAAEHGPPLQISGPTLWDVLQHAGAIDQNFHRRVRQAITVTGLDGYSATVALGEIDPEFGGRAILLGLNRDGTPLDAPRLAIPGDKRLGRDVRDVVRLEVR